MKNFNPEIVAALRSGDMETLGVIALEMAALLAGVTDGREKAAERQRRSRASRRATAVIVTPGHVTDVTPSLPPFPSLSSPTTLLNPSLPSIPPEQSEHAAAEVVFENVALALSAQLGDRIDDVRAFLRTRQPHTRPAWMKAMLRLIGPGSQFSVGDLGDACTDALALDKPIEGPHALRAFVAKQREERHKAHAEKTAGRIGPTTRADRDAARERELRDEKTLRADEEAWKVKRDIAGAKWRRDNEVEASILSVEIEKKLSASVAPGHAMPTWVRSAIEDTLMARAATEAGFPDFDTWRNNKGSAA